MTAKKRWLLKTNDLCSQASNNTNLNISWSSSGSNSEDDYSCGALKRFKGSHNYKIKNFSNNWINLCDSNQCNVSDDSIDENDESKFNSEFRCEALTEVDMYKPSLSSNHSFEESPILTNLKLGELSPVLGSFQREIPSPASSPIIGRQNLNYKIQKSVKHKNRSEEIKIISTPIPKLATNNTINKSSPKVCKNLMQHLVTIENDSPELFEKSQSLDIITQQSVESHSSCVCPNIESSFLTQQSVVLIENDSPKSSEKIRPESVLSESSSKSPTNIIEPFQSQECSEIVFNTDSSQTSSSKSSNLEPLYHESLPKKRKKYKKNSIAQQLQQALHKQKMDFAICRHELYLNKSTGYEVSDSYDERLILLLKIKKFWKEFGITLVECEHVTNEKNSGNLNKDSSLGNDSILPKTLKEMQENCDINKDSTKLCLVIIGCNVTHGIKIKMDAKFKLYPPYMTKKVMDGEEHKYCYFNVSKIFTVK